MKDGETRWLPPWPLVTGDCISSALNPCSVSLRHPGLSLLSRSVSLTLILDDTVRSSVVDECESSLAFSSLLTSPAVRSRISASDDDDDLAASGRARTASSGCTTFDARGVASSPSLGSRSIDRKVESELEGMGCGTGLRAESIVLVLLLRGEDQVDEGGLGVAAPDAGL
jgi:hypothetical protein